MAVSQNYKHNFPVRAVMDNRNNKQIPPSVNCFSLVRLSVGDCLLMEQESLHRDPLKVLHIDCSEMLRLCRQSLYI